MSEKEKNEKSGKSIKIIYSNYEVIQDGSIRWKDKEVIVPFSKDMTEYVTNQSYRDNMEAMILDIFESGYVFISDKIAIPVFNIKQFIAFDEVEAGRPVMESKNVAQLNGNRQGHKWHNKKKFQDKRPDTNQGKELIISENFPIKEKVNQSIEN